MALKPATLVIYTKWQTLPCSCWLQTIIEEDQISKSNLPECKFIVAKPPLTKLSNAFEHMNNMSGYWMCVYIYIYVKYLEELFSSGI